MILTEEMMIQLVLYAILNIFAFLTFADDKMKAKNNSWRTSERRLLLYALVGPIGALAAIWIFRHKTQKKLFKLVYLFLAIHIGIIGYLLYSILF